jgi:lactoylglutathione lyase
MIKGLFETHLFVNNLENSVDFYSNKLELEKCYYEEGRRTAFFWIGKPRQFMLGLWEKPTAQIEPQHFAFECDPEWIINESVNYLNERKIKCRNFLGDDTERPMVFAWMPAVSIYFDDPDKHTLEFIGILNGKSKPENGIITYQKWKELEGI